MAQVFSRINRIDNNFNRVVTGSTVRLVNDILDTMTRSAGQLAPTSNPTDRTHSPDVGHRPRRSIRESHNKVPATESSVTGRGNIAGRLENLSPHALIVHEGRTRIFEKGKLMRFKVVAGPHRGLYKRHVVSGAASQPWLVDAYNSAVERHAGTQTVQPASRVRRRIQID